MHVYIGNSWNTIDSSYDNNTFNSILKLKNIDINIDEVENNYRFVCFEEDSLAALRDSFNKSLGIDKLNVFNKDIVDVFNVEEKFKQNCKFIKMYIYYVKNIQFFLPGNYTITEAFKKHSDGRWAPKEFFLSFGTHVLKQVLIGGRLEYSLIYPNNGKNLNLQSIYKLFIGKASKEEKEEALDIQNNASFINAKIIGGFTPSNYDFEEIEKIFSEWVYSLTFGGSGIFCGIESFSSLIPIWHFMENKEYAKLVEKEFYNLTKID